MSKPLNLCYTILIDNSLADKMSTVMLHPAVGQPSQPWLLFWLVFFFECGGICCCLGAWFVLFEIDGMFSGSGICNRLHMPAVGKARKLGL